MSRDVLITPASGLVQFRNSGNTQAQIELSTGNNLSITSTTGNISVGTPGTNVFIGDGTNSVDMIFEQNGAIRPLSGRTLTLGASGAFISFASNISSGANITGNITGGNLSTTGAVVVTGTAAATNTTTGSIRTAGGLGVAGNAYMGGLLSVTGNITGGNVSGTNIVGTLTTASQPNITGVGTITSGNWNATAIAVARGGTGQTTYTNGQLLIGNTTGNTLTKATLTAGTGVTITNGAGSISLAIAQAVATTSSVRFGSFGVGTNASGTTGEIRATNNITAFFSDRRLKTDIRPLDHALERVRAISGVTFRSSAVAAQYGYLDSSTQVGVIAQEVAEVLPEVVVPAPFDIGQRDDGTEFSLSGQDYKTVRYEKLVPLLIEAIKDLDKSVTNLAQEIDHLRKNTDL